MTSLPKIVDALLEGPVAPSFTRIGYDVRKRVADWEDIDSFDLSGRVMLITGATSGLGLAAARRLATAGAELILLGRNPSKTNAVCTTIATETGNPNISPVIADMGDMDAVRDAAASVGELTERLDVLVHNAGALSDQRVETGDGLEATIASQVVGPFLMTGLLLDLLSSSQPARVVTVSSGGMYSTRLTVDGLEMTADDYRGAEQYARAKRAQVTLNELWADKTEGSGVYFHAMHPGWADTPGVEEALPVFRRIVGPLLRTPDQGADTMVWLAGSDGVPLQKSGGFWHDRQVRSLHKVPVTRRSDTPERRDRLWSWCESISGWSLA